MSLSDTEKDESDQAATLLLVDDESNILSALRRLFHPMGYHILIANNGVEGLQIMEYEKVDLFAILGTVYVFILNGLI